MTAALPHAVPGVPIPPDLSVAEILHRGDELADLVAPGATRRDAERIRPHRELTLLRRSGLTAIRVPRSHGGPDAARSTVIEVTRRLAVADPNIAQIPQSHFVFTEVLRLTGTRDQADRWWPRILAGDLVANAQAERGNHGPPRTPARADGDAVIITGDKNFCTGSPFAQILAVVAAGPAPDAAGGADERPVVVALVDRDADGVEVEDDWDALGQRTTSSGTVRLRDLRVATTDLLSRDAAVDSGRGYGAFAQALHAAVDVGIARAALLETTGWWRRGSHGEPDLLTAARAGELELEVTAAEALLRRAGEALDLADSDPSSAGDASIAVAAARAVADRAALSVSTGVYDLIGSAAATSGCGLDRHWRNARTHTLHDPVRLKIQALGRHALTGEHPTPDTRI